MSVSRTELLSFLDGLLKPGQVKDYCPNGLQVEGKMDIQTLVTGVTASQALIDRAVEERADAILVHHGYFWKGENPCITGMKKQRLATLLKHDISLFAYHLPLDIHPQLGNNAQLAKLFGITQVRPLEEGNPTSVVMRGELAQPLSAQAFHQSVSSILGRKVLHEPSAKQHIQSLAWCSGGGQGYIEQAAELGIDAYLTGEVSEQTIHVAREMGIHFFAAGHHATERYGAKAVGERLQQELDLRCVFVDIDNPA